MRPIQPEIIRRKLSVIIGNLQTLEPVAKLRLEEYRKDLFRKKGTERLLQELIEAAVDINLHIVTRLGEAAPDDYYRSFIQLGEKGILPMNLTSNWLLPRA